MIQRVIALMGIRVQKQQRKRSEMTALYYPGDDNSSRIRKEMESPTPSPEATESIAAAADSVLSSRCALRYRRRGQREGVGGRQLGEVMITKEDADH